RLLHIRWLRSRQPGNPRLACGSLSLARRDSAQWQHRTKRKTALAGVLQRDLQRARFRGQSRGRSHGHSAGRAADRADTGMPPGGVRLLLQRASANGPLRRWRQGGYCPGSRSLMAPASSFTLPPSGNLGCGQRRRSPALARSLRCCCADSSWRIWSRSVRSRFCLGFTVATFKTSLIEHPVLPFATSGVTVAGFVELREESQHTDRFVLRVERIEGGRIDALADDKPQRVRLSVKRGMAPPAGSFVQVKASLEPQLQPLEPGSYDFARDLFFLKIGTSGFVRGAVKIVAEPAPQGLLQRADAFVQRLRDAIDARIRAVLPGDKGAIAAMLIDGKRDAIAPNVYDALFVSGIGHVLSISGYHMAIAAGVIFFIVRAFFALIPGLAERASIKK